MTSLPYAFALQQILSHARPISMSMSIKKGGGWRKMGEGFISLIGSRIPTMKADEVEIKPLSHTATPPTWMTEGFERVMPCNTEFLLFS